MTPTENLIYQFFTWTCVAASIVLKLPQLITVIQSKSVRGMSTPAIMLECWSFAAMLAYQFAQKMPILQYIDYVFLMFQEIPLFLLVLHYNGHFNVWAMIYGAVFSAVFGSVAAGVTTPAFNTILINANTPISALSKLTQLSTIIREKSAGSVSITTWSLAAYTCIARLITLWMETPDVSLLVLYVVAGTLNIAIVTACLFYGSGKPTGKPAAAAVTKKRDSSPPPQPQSSSAPQPRRSPRKAD